jgi:hypothetical protein
VVSAQAPVPDARLDPSGGAPVPAAVSSAGTARFSGRAGPGWTRAALAFVAAAGAQSATRPGLLAPGQLDRRGRVTVGEQGADQ